MIAEGSNGNIVINNDVIKISRKGIANFFTQGLQGEKTVPISSIRAVQFKEAGRWTAGYIQFSTIGSIDRPGGMLEATKDENAVLFERSQQKPFEKVRETIERLINAPDRSASPAFSAAEELEKLAGLVERGFLTREEFEAKKADILSR